MGGGVILLMFYWCSIDVILEKTGKHQKNEKFGFQISSVLMDSPGVLKGVRKVWIELVSEKWPNTPFWPILALFIRWTSCKYSRYYHHWPCICARRRRAHPLNTLPSWRSVGCSERRTMGAAVPHKRMIIEEPRPKAAAKQKDTLGSICPDTNTY